MNLFEKAGQIAQSFDPATKAKIKKSAEIAFVGFLVGAIPLIVPDILKMAEHYPIAGIFITSMGGWLYNTLKEWLAGQPKDV